MCLLVGQIEVGGASGALEEQNPIEGLGTERESLVVGQVNSHPVGQAGRSDSLPTDGYLPGRVGHRIDHNSGKVPGNDHRRPRYPTAGVENPVTIFHPGALGESDYRSLGFLPGRVADPHQAGLEDRTESAQKHFGPPVIEIRPGRNGRG
jgi:hypothetical protein